jgi:hypothetical protein
MFVELRVHQHHFERLDALNLYLTSFFVIAPGSSHHVIGTCDQSSAFLIPMNRAYVNRNLKILFTTILYMG